MKLWGLRLWVALGLLLGVVAAVGSLTTSHSTVYASASTQMLVDSPESALANASVDLSGYTARATIFARLMTSAAALQDIGKAAGIDGNLIAATGPVETDGSPPATHAPVAVVGGKDVPAPDIYSLSLVQNPSLPTVDVYARAPTTAQAIKLADGAVTGFAEFIDQLNSTSVSQGNRIEVRQLGEATGGMVDPSASKKIGVLVFVAVFSMWCFVVLGVSRLRASLRETKRDEADDLFGLADDPLPSVSVPAVADDLSEFGPDEVARDQAEDPDQPFHRNWATTRTPSRP